MAGGTRYAAGLSGPARSLANPYNKSAPAALVTPRGRQRRS
jgi:hypothetical protein